MKASTLVGVARHTPTPLLRLATYPPLRRLVIKQIFAGMPELLSNTGRKARGVIRFDIDCGSRVDTWYAVLGDGQCATSRHAEARPRVTISLSAFDFVRLASGSNAIELFSAGGLRLAGDTYFGASVGELFDLG
jgi:hypothetical protein